MHMHGDRNRMLIHRYIETTPCSLCMHSFSFFKDENTERYARRMQQCRPFSSLLHLESYAVTADNIQFISKSFLLTVENIFSGILILAQFSLPRRHIIAMNY